eukprot:1157844-Pelagomonas_calceolata.AAC.6
MTACRGQKRTIHSCLDHTTPLHGLHPKQLDLLTRCNDCLQRAEAQHLQLPYDCNAPVHRPHLQETVMTIALQQRSNQQPCGHKF